MGHFAAFQADTFDVYQTHLQIRHRHYWNVVMAQDVCPTNSYEFEAFQKFYNSAIKTKSFYPAIKKTKTTPELKHLKQLLIPLIKEPNEADRLI